MCTEPLALQGSWKSWTMAAVTIYCVCVVQIDNTIGFVVHAALNWIPVISQGGMVVHYSVCPT